MALISNAEVIPPKQTISKGESPEITSLASKAARLQTSANFWTKLYLGLVFFAAALTFGTFVAQYLSTTKSQELVNTEELLSAEKGRILAGELREKDLKIEEARTRGATAEARAALADQRASEATARVKEAEAQIALANAASKEAVAKVAEAQRDAAKASEGTAKVELALVGQRERAAKAESDLLSLQNRLKPRAISGQQRAVMIARLRGVPKDGSIEISSMPGDGEGYSFAEQIEKVLKDAGFSTTLAQGMFSRSPVGVILQVGDPLTGPTSAGEIQYAFGLAMIPFESFVLPGIPKGTLQIIVGSKP